MKTQCIPKIVGVILCFVILSASFISCTNNKSKDEPADVRVIPLTYKTQGVDGTILDASGLLMVPPAGNGPFPMLSAQHGTIFDRHVAPTFIDSCLEAQAWMTEVAAKGYVVVMADYIGLGKAGTTLHPYFHAQTEATATRDMILAARQYCLKNGILLNDRLFLVGYSQGGHVTASLQRLLETKHKDEFHITASAIMAAPLDLNMLFQHHVTKPGTISSAVTSLMANTYHWIYSIAKTPNEIFVPPYDSLIPALLDFNHPETVVIKTLSKPPSGIFQPQFLAGVAAGSHAFNTALNANQVFDWIPRSPTLLVYSMADEVVPFAICEKAYKAMVAQGGKVDTVNLGNKYNHADGFIPALLKAREWFDGFK